MFRNLTVRRWLQGRVTAAVLCLLFLAGGPGRPALAQPNHSVFLPGRASLPSQKADLPSFMSGGSAVEPKGSGPSSGLPRPVPPATAAIIVAATRRSQARRAVAALIQGLVLIHRPYTLPLTCIHSEELPVAPSRFASWTRPPC